MFDLVRSGGLGTVAGVLLWVCAAAAVVAAACESTLRREARGPRGWVPYTLQPPDAFGERGQRLQAIGRGAIGTMYASAFAAALVLVLRALG